MAKVPRNALSRARGLRRKLTKAEVMLWSRLRMDVCGVRFRRQHPIQPYIADFACAPALLIVEVDGATHSSDAEREYDARREQYFNARGWKIRRFWNDDVYNALDDVVEEIRRIAHSRMNGSSRD